MDIFEHMLNEISKEKLKQYVKVAHRDAERKKDDAKEFAHLASFPGTGYENKLRGQANRANRQWMNRHSGIDKAVDKLAGRTDEEDLKHLKTSTLHTKMSEAKKAGDKRAVDAIQKELEHRKGLHESEQLDEISKQMMANYVKKSVTDAGRQIQIRRGHDERGTSQRPENRQTMRNALRKHDNRNKGVHRALTKLAGDDPEKKKLAGQITRSQHDQHVAMDDQERAAHMRRSNSPWGKHLDKIVDKSKHDIAHAADRLAKESVENLDEISKQMLGRYIKGAAADSNKYSEYAGRRRSTNLDKEQAYKARSEKRRKGINKAVDKIASRSDEAELKHLKTSTLRSKMSEAKKAGDKRAVDAIQKELRNRAGYNLDEEDCGASSKQEDNFHIDLDKLVHKTFGKSPKEQKNDE